MSDCTSKNLVPFSGHCPQCGCEMEADAIDQLFDIRPSCKVCGTWLESPITYVEDDSQFVPMSDEDYKICVDALAKLRADLAAKKSPTPTTVDRAQREAVD